MKFRTEVEFMTTVGAGPDQMEDKAHIRLERIQTYLFAVPRLRGMVGANALLGDLLHKELPDLARGNTRPITVEQLCLKPASGDPLQDQDDLRVQLAEGILSQDGGHFEAFFKNSTEAACFVKKAAAYIRRTKLNLRFSADPDDASSGSRKHCGVDRTDLPHFQVCQDTGRGPASDIIVYKDEPERYISLAAGERHRKLRKKPEEAIATDWAGRLQPHLALHEMKAPDDFEELVGSEYLAVIHADGNGIGRRSGQNGRGAPSMDELIRRQVFFHSMRSAVRASLVAAIDLTFRDFPESNARPYEILMLGGDDLLLVCRASYAMQFLVHYANILSACKLSDGEPLSVGAGVAIARHTVPFHHLYEIAEKLAGSAKRLARAYGNQVSTVDWEICTGSWWDDPFEVRRREALRFKVNDGSPLVLTGRPLPILDTSLGSLQGIFCAANRLGEAVESKGAARSQFRHIAGELRQGYWHGRLAWDSMSSDSRCALEAVGLQDPWEAKDRFYLSRLPDLIELFEIPRLGRTGREGGWA
jgi:hypothetical protein